MTQRLSDILRQRGHRITPQREMILDAVGQHQGHITAEAVLDVVRTRSQAINSATIYRTLDFLVREGLATRVSFEQGRTIYAMHEHGAHLHLVCRGCGQVLDVPAAQLVELAAAVLVETGFQIDMHHGALAGWCSACRDRVAQMWQHGADE